MSVTNSLKPLELENVLDPRLNAMKYVQDKLKWGIFKGCENQNWTAVNADSYSQAGLNWNFNTQSENVLIDRRLYCLTQFLMTFTGTSPIGQPLLNDEFDAPRAFPLASVTSSLKVSINGASVETQYADSLQAMLRYNCDANLFDYDLSGTPNYLDNFQNYADGAGTNRNPLSNYFNSPCKMGRGAFHVDTLSNPVSVDGVTPTTSTVLFTVCEPLFVSPMLYKSSTLGSALLGVQTLGVQFTFKSGQLARVWSHAANPGVTITSAVCSIGPGATTTPYLLVNYLNPPLIDIAQRPAESVYQYYKIDTYVTDMNVTVAPNASVTKTNSANQIANIPKRIYIYATDTESNKTYETTDTFYEITSISLSYLNVSGQFSTMTQNDLYNMCVKNGLKMNFVEFTGLTQRYSTGAQVGLTGSVLCIDVEDLAIPSNLAPGVGQNSQLQFTITVKNTNQTVSKGLQITTVVIYDGLITIAQGGMQTQNNVITQNDVMQTRMSGKYVDYKNAQNVYGGDFFSKLASLGKTALEGSKSACNLLSKSGMGAYMGSAIVGGARCKTGSRKTPIEWDCKKKKVSKKGSKKGSKKRSTKKSKGKGVSFDDSDSDGGELEEWGGRMMSRDELRSRFM